MVSQCSNACHVRAAAPCPPQGNRAGRGSSWAHGHRTCTDLATHRVLSAPLVLEAPNPWAKTDTSTSLLQTSDVGWSSCWKHPGRFRQHFYHLGRDTEDTQQHICVLQTCPSDSFVLTQFQIVFSIVTKQKKKCHLDPWAFEEGFCRTAIFPDSWNHRVAKTQEYCTCCNPVLSSPVCVKSQTTNERGRSGGAHPLLPGAGSAKAAAASSLQVQGSPRLWIFLPRCSKPCLQVISSPYL